MTVDFEMDLIEALDALERGETVDAILSRYPESAASLRPILATTVALPALRMQPSEAQKMASRQAFLKQGAALRQTAQRRTKLGFVPRLATLFAAFSMTLVVLGGGAVAASGSALPGDPLYGLKRTVENTRLTFTVDAVARTALQAQFDLQRRLEASALLDAGRETDVQFSGPIESIQPDAWVIGGLVVRLDANTQISGQPQIDRLAHVRGVTGRSGLRAQSITLDQGVEPTPETPVATPIPTNTPVPTATPNSLETPDPTEPRPTHEPQPTATPVPPKPVAIEFTGSVNSQAGDSWIIDGATVYVDGNTVLDGNIGVGQRVKVQALRYPSGRLLATRIELISDGGGGGGNGGGEDNNANQNTNDNSDNHNDDNGNDNHNEDNSNENGGNDNHNGNDNSDNHNDNNGNDNKY